MVIFQWNQDLEIGIELVDKQHKKLIETANSFFIRCKCGHGRDALEECLSFLEQYILYHFQYEQAFMVECGYPEYRAHQAIHDAMAKKVKFCTVRLRGSDYGSAEIEEFYKFLCDWIREHILINDVAFSKYYTQFKFEEREDGKDEGTGHPAQ